METALIMPFSVFMILGILQLSLMQQARLLTEYAAYRAVRAGSLNQLDCKHSMLQAADEALLPTLGRTDTATELAKTWVKAPESLPITNRYLTGLTIAKLKYIVTVDSGTGGPKAPYTAQDFDDPDHPLTLTAELTYRYQLRIPFADFMIWEMWTGMNALGNKTDELMPASKHPIDPTRLANHAGDIVKYRLGHHYYVPIITSYSMRMMSNLPMGTAIGTQGSCK
ncbi:MAG: TadE/TadG family type IV pilus assembly protein [Solirubrobacteraceae bacterium]